MEMTVAWAVLEKRGPRLRIADNQISPANVAECNRKAEQLSWAGGIDATFDHSAVVRLEAALFNHDSPGESGAINNKVSRSAPSLRRRVKCHHETKKHHAKKAGVVQSPAPV